MGSILSSVLSPIRKACWEKCQKSSRDRDYGRPFIEMLRDHHQYGPWIKAHAVFEVRLVHRNSIHHWYILLRPKGTSTLPYISMEVTTSDMSDLVPVTRNFESYDASQVSDLGTYEGTLFNLCELADRVVEEMENYNLFSSNCQTFCNKLLKKIGKNEFPTSLESELIDREFDLLSKVFQKERVVPATKLNVQVWETVVCEPIETSEFVLPEKVLPPRMGDLKTVHKILVPVQSNWMGIGAKLRVQNLNAVKKTYRGIANQCLREMLREYLQRSNPSPSWIELAEAVKEYSHPVALSIIKEAKRVHAN